MRSPAKQLVRSRHFKSFTEEIIVYYLGNIDRGQKRDGNRRRFSHKERADRCEAGSRLKQIRR
jgi:hypothetical protein